MVKTTNKNNAESISRVSPKHLSQEPTYTPKNLNNDDLIKSLANAYENKRARQVIEWEQNQRINWTQIA